MPQIDAPDELTIPPIFGGNQETFDSLAFWNTRGVICTDEPGGRSTIVISTYLFPLASLERWCSLGSRVSGYLVFHRLVDNFAQVVCPYSDPPPGEDPETWAQWGVGPNGEFAPFQKGDGKWYRDNRLWPNGVHVDGADFYQYIDAPNPAQTGIEALLSLEEFQQVPDPPTS